MQIQSLDACKKGYETFIQASEKSVSETTALLQEGAGRLAPIQKTGEEIYRHVVENQIELCRFFAGRWEHYLTLPSEISHCRTPADIAQLQLAFVTKMASDYTQEGSRLARPFQEIVSNAMTSQQKSAA